MGKRIAVLLAVLLLALAVPTIALADDGSTGRFVLGGNYTLASGETLNGDLVVMGGNATIEQDSLVLGNVVVFGGSVAVAGQVDKGISVFGGSLQLESTALVMGQLISVGGSVSRQPGAEVRGDIVEGMGNAPFPFRGNTTIVETTGANRVLGFFGQLFGIVLSTLAIMALALLAVLLLPQQTEQVVKVMLAQPALSFGAGLLTIIVMPILLIVLIITCIGPFLLGLAFGIAVLFGWIAVGLLLGRKLLEAAKAKQTTALVEVLIGVAIITLLGRVPCIGWLFSLAVASYGLGAVILSRFGTTSYPWPTTKDVDASAAGGVPKALNAESPTEGDTAKLGPGAEEGQEGPADDLGAPEA